MYSRVEKKELNTSFFNGFAQYMSTERSIGGGGGRWESYKTGVKGLYFRILTKPVVGIAIDLQFKDKEIRDLFYDQFVELGKLLENEWKEKPVFDQDIYLDSGEQICRIWLKLEDAYFFDKTQWPVIMKWYKEKLVGLDIFWDMAGDVVKGLAK